MKCSLVLGCLVCFCAISFSIKVKPYSGNTVGPLSVMWIPYEHWGRFRSGFGIVKELTERGHNVVVVMNNNTVAWTERSDFKALNLTLWNIGNICDAASIQKNELPKKKGSDALDLLTNSFLTYEREVTRALLAFPAFNDSFFDVLLCDTVEMVGITVEHLLQVPLVRYSTLPASSEVTFSSSYVGTVATGLGNRMNSLERIQAWVMKQLYRFVIYPRFSDNLELMEEIGLSEWRNSPQYKVDIEKAPVLTVYPWGMEYPYPLPPNRIVVGPTRVFRRDGLEPIPEEIMRWLEEESPSGKAFPVLYVSMGTTGIPPVDLMRKIATTLNLLTSQQGNSKEVRVIWALPVKDNSTLFDIIDDLIGPSYFFYPTKWIPQASILASDLLYGFWTHGGANSLVESISFGKPVLCTPLFLDQTDNCQRADDQGFGILVSTEADVGTLRESLSKLLHTQSYIDNAWRVGRIIELGRGAARSADFIEMVAEVGYEHLVPEYLYLPWYLQFDLDIYLFVVLSLLILTGIVSAPFYCLFRCCRQRMRKPSSKSKKE